MNPKSLPQSSTLHKYWSSKTKFSNTEALIFTSNYTKLRTCFLGIKTDCFLMLGELSFSSIFDHLQFTEWHLKCLIIWTFKTTTSFLPLLMYFHVFVEIRFPLHLFYFFIKIGRFLRTQIMTAIKKWLYICYLNIARNCDAIKNLLV